MKTLRIAKAVAGMAMALTALASTAAAQYELNIVGSANVMNNPGSGGSQLLIDFLPTINAVPTITLPGIAIFQAGTISDVVVDVTGCVNCTVNPFITIGGYTFTLTSTPLAPAGPFNFGPVSLTDGANGATASLSVNGTLTGGVYGTQTATYIGVFTAQFTGQTSAQVFNAINSGGTRNVSFSADLITSPPSTVPEPATFALMATGLVTLVGFARRRRNEA